MAVDRNKVEAVILAEDLASSTMSLISSEAMGMVGKFGALGLAAGGLTAGLVGVTKAAIEEEKQWRKLSIALDRAHLDTRAMLPIYQEMTDRMEELTGVADVEISGAFAAMTRALIPAAAQQGLMNIALDASAASGRNLRSIVDMLIKGQSGYSRELDRFGAELGIATKEGAAFSEILKEIADRTRGEAMLQQADLSGQIDYWGTLWERLKDTIGGDLVPGLAGAVGSIADAFNYFRGVEPDVAAKIRDITMEIDKLDKYRAAWNYLPPEDEKRYTELKTSLRAIMTEYKAAAKAEADATAAMFVALQGPLAEWNRILDEPIPEQLGRMNEEIHQTAVETAVATGQTTQYVEMLLRLDGVARDLTGSFSAINNSASPLAIGEDVIARIRDMGQSIEGSFSGIGDEIPDVMGNIAESSRKAAGEMDREFNRSANAMGEAFGNLRMMMKGNDEDMLADFIQYFVLPMLPQIDGLIGGILNLFQIWDVRENDEALIAEGRRGGSLLMSGFADGVRAGMPGSIATAGALAYGGSSGGGTTTIIHFHGNVTDDEYVNRKIIPAIERAVRTGNSSLVRREIPNGRRLGQ